MTFDPGEPERANPYQNIAEDDVYRPPQPTEYVSTASIGCVVMLCLLLFVGLGIVASAITFAPGSNPIVILMVLLFTIAFPIAVGWAAISWLRTK